MNDSLFSTKDMVKYLIVAGLVYTILKMIPSVQLADKDLMLLLAIITVGFVCLDCLFLKKTEGFANDELFTLDLNTDINELIKQRQGKKNTTVSENITKDEIRIANEEIKKLDGQISNAFSGADAEKSKKAKAEMETKLEKLKAKKVTTEESNKVSKIHEEKSTVEEEHLNAIKSNKAAEERLDKLNARKTDTIKNGTSAEVLAVSEEILVATKAKQVADEYVKIIAKRRETIDKKLADIPVSASEEYKIAIDERNIAQEKVVVAEELKAIAEKRGSTSSELKQVLEEKSSAIRAYSEAEDRLVEVEERKRIVIDESIKLPENEPEEVTRGLAKTSCGIEVEKIKRQMEEQLTELKEQLQARTAIPPSSAKIANRYFESLMNDLADKGILEATEIDNIQAKLRTKLLSMDEVIASLETLKKEGKSKIRVQDGKVKNDREYSELPSDFYTPIGQQVPNEWSSEYTILNTNKWQVPMPRPPVCINTQPCKVCPSDTSNNSTNLKQWDDSRYVSGGRINKKWAEDQISA